MDKHKGIDKKYLGANVKIEGDITANGRIRIDEKIRDLEVDIKRLNNFIAQSRYQPSESSFINLRRLQSELVDARYQKERGYIWYKTGQI